MRGKKSIQMHTKKKAENIILNTVQNECFNKAIALENSKEVAG